MKTSLTIIFFILVNVLRNLIGVVRAKIIAVTWGVTQFGVLGQLITFFNFQNVYLVFGTKVALVNYIGKSPGTAKPIFLGTGLVLLFSNFSLILCCTLFSRQLTLYLFDAPDYLFLLIFLLLLSPLISVKELLESTYQAEKAFTVIARCQTISLGTALLAIGPLVYGYGVMGVIIDLAIWYGFSIIYYLPGKLDFLKIDRNDLTAMRRHLPAIIRLCTLNVTRHLAIVFSYLIVRIIIVQLLSIEEAGYYQAIWGVANYVNIIIQGFAFYFFPTINAVTDIREMKEKISENFELLIYILFPIVLILLIVPEFILLVLYSSEYTFLSVYLVWLIIGKIFEGCYIFYLMVLVGQSKIRSYFIVEIFRSILHVLLPYIGLSQFGFPGLVGGVVIAQLMMTLAIAVKIWPNKSMRPSGQLMRQLTYILAGFTVISLIPTTTFISWFARAGIAILMTATILDMKKYVAVFEMIKTRGRST